MAAARTGMVNGTGYRIHLAALFCRKPRGDQRTAGRAGLHHQHAQRQTADDAVAPRKVTRLRRTCQWQLGHQRAPLLGNCRRQRFMPRRINALQTGAQHGYGFAMSIQRALVGRTINAQCQPAGDNKAATRQAVGETLRGVQPRTRRAAAADHGQLRLLQQTWITVDKQQRRRIMQLRQQAGIDRLVPHQQVMVFFVQPSQAARSTVADLGAAPGVTAYGWQTQRTPCAGGCTEGRAGSVKGAEQFTKAFGAEFRQAVQAQARFQLSGRNGRGKSRGLRHPNHP